MLLRTVWLGKYVCDLFMAPFSQGLEPPQIPGRFNPLMASSACVQTKVGEGRATTAVQQRKQIAGRQFDSLATGTVVGDG